MSATKKKRANRNGAIKMYSMFLFLYFSYPAKGMNIQCTPPPYQERLVGDQI